jgi:uncharacterized membrane protein
MSASRRSKKPTISKNQLPRAMSNKSHEVQFMGEDNGKTKTIAGKFYQGILPSPEMMEHYQRIDPSLPDRILKLTEGEAQHRRDCDKKIINHAFFSALVGNICGILAIAGLGFLSYQFLLHGRPTQGAVIAGSSATVVGIFVIRKQIASKGQSEK